MTSILARRLKEVRASATGLRAIRGAWNPGPVQLDATPESILHAIGWLAHHENAMTPVWRTIERFLAEHGTAAGLTLVESAGSSLREISGGVMVRLDGRFFGTIGGGATHA